MSQVLIRRATPEDASALAALHVDCWDDAYTGLMPQHVLDERRRDLPARVVRWRRLLQPGGIPNLLAVAADGDLVGFASSGPGRSSGSGSGSDTATDLELMALYVRASCWGTGVGHALLGQAIGDRAAYLWVLAGNDRAIRFYQRQGFALDGAEDLHDEGLHVRMVRTSAEGTT